MNYTRDNARAIILQRMGVHWTPAALVRYWLIRAGYDRPAWVGELLAQMVEDGTLEHRWRLVHLYRRR